MAHSPRVAVILAGGSGERFWPLSTPERPKQLLKLASETQTLLEEAIERAEPLVSRECIFVATGAGVGAAIIESGLLPPDRVLIEPMAKNTLGALCWAAYELRSRGFSDETTMAVLTADHAIGSPEVFRGAVLSAMQLAEETEGLVTIGIQPSRPETGYGYIQVGSPAGPGFQVRRFAEKPDLADAEAYLKSGDYLWNSGMFFWRIGAFLSELRRHVPEAASILDRLPASFAEMASAPVDKALMEHSDKIYVFPGKFPWDDVGAWDSLSRTHDADESGNVMVGGAMHIESSGSIVFSDGIPVGVIGVEDLIVVATANGVLVCHRSQAQRVKEIVAKLKG